LINDDDKPKGWNTRPQVLKIVRYPHPALRRENKLVEKFDDKLKQFAENLFRTLYNDPTGVGLAAPQVGVNLRMLVYNIERCQDDPLRQFERVIINPRIVAKSDELSKLDETCLSFPNIEPTRVWRASWVEMEGFDLEGKPFKDRFEGMEAAAMQHEFEHLEGIIFTDRIEEELQPSLRPMLDELIADYKARGGSQPKL